MPFCMPSTNDQCFKVSLDALQPTSPNLPAEPQAVAASCNSNSLNRYPTARNYSGFYMWRPIENTSHQHISTHPLL